MLLDIASGTLPPVVWYKPTGKDSPRIIAKKMVNLLKEATN